MIALKEAVNKKINVFLFLFLAELRRFTVLNVPSYSGELEFIFFFLKLLIGLLINFSSCCYQVVNCSYENHRRSMAVILREDQVCVDKGNSGF